MWIQSSDCQAKNCTLTCAKSVYLHPRPRPLTLPLSPPPSAPNPPEAPSKRQCAAVCLRATLTEAAGCLEVGVKDCQVGLLASTMANLGPFLEDELGGESQLMRVHLSNVAVTLTVGGEAGAVHRGSARRMCQWDFPEVRLYLVLSVCLYLLVLDWYSKLVVALGMHRSLNI